MGRSAYICPMADVQDLVDEASAILLAPVTLEDRRFRLLAFAAHAGDVDSVPAETVLSRGARPRTREWFESFDIARASAPVHVPGDPERGTQARLCLPARWRGVTQGYLWAVEPPEGLTTERVRAATVLADQAGEHLARLTSRRRETERLVLDLLGRAGSGSMRSCASSAGSMGLPPNSSLAIWETALVESRVRGASPRDSTNLARLVGRTLRSGGVWF